MIDITSKQKTLRTATARGKIHCDQYTLDRVRHHELPKGDPFGVARAAGLLAAKQTQFLIPHCHPVSIDNLIIDFHLEDDGIAVECSAKSIGRTGIEMEVLTAVSVAALTIYDQLKPLKRDMEISGIKLTQKTGGRSQMRTYVERDLKIAILVTSDGAAAGEREDRSGKVIRDLLNDYGIETAAGDYRIVPDEPERIREAVLDWSGREYDFIFSTGGTGLGPRDVTTETLRGIIEREAPGIAEAMRAHGQERTPVAMLSRSIAGVIGKSVVVAVPGSSGGARESLEAILPAVFHARDMIRGGGHD